MVKNPNHHIFMDFSTFEIDTLIFFIMLIVLLICAHPPPTKIKTSDTPPRSEGAISSVYQHVPSLLIGK
jgi:hypothetical protein